MESSVAKLVSSSFFFDSLAWLQSQSHFALPLLSFFLSWFCSQRSMFGWKVRPSTSWISFQSFSCFLLFSYSLPRLIKQSMQEVLLVFGFFLAAICSLLTLILGLFCSYAWACLLAAPSFLFAFFFSMTASCLFLSSYWNFLCTLVTSFLLRQIKFVSQSKVPIKPEPSWLACMAYSPLAKPEMAAKNTLTLERDTNS